jgi:hypothetical protein
MSDLGWDPPVPGIPTSECLHSTPPGADGWSVHWHDLYHPTYSHGSYGRITVCECATIVSHGPQSEILEEADALMRIPGRGQTEVVVRNGSRVVSRWP